jgi:hypothetical protein
MTWPDVLSLKEPKNERDQFYRGEKPAIGVGLCARTLPISALEMGLISRPHIRLLERRSLLRGVGPLGMERRFCKEREDEGEKDSNPGPRARVLHVRLA